MITNAIHRLREIYESTKDSKIADLESRLIKSEFEKRKSDLLRSHYDTTKELRDYKRNSLYHQGSDPFGRDQGNKNQNNQNNNNNQGNKNQNNNNKNNQQGNKNQNQNNQQGNKKQGNKNQNNQQVKRKK